MADKTAFFGSCNCKHRLIRRAEITRIRDRAIQRKNTQEKPQQVTSDMYDGLPFCFRNSDVYTHFPRVVITYLAYASSPIFVLSKLICMGHKIGMQIHISVSICLLTYCNFSQYEPKTSLNTLAYINVEDICMDCVIVQANQKMGRGTIPSP